jgi:hypothetical protein
MRGSNEACNQFLRKPVYGSHIEGIQLWMEEFRSQVNFSV